MNMPRLNDALVGRVRRPVPSAGHSSVAGDSGTTLIGQHPTLTVYGVGIVLALAMLPLLHNPLYVFALAGLLIAGLIAWHSPVVPLALSGIPPLVDAIVGHDPLPSGGFTLLFSAWITAAIAFSLLRGRQRAALRTTLLSVSVLSSVALLGLMLLRVGVSPDQAYGSQKVQLYAADVLIILVAAVFVGTRPSYLRVFVLALLALNGVGALLFLYNLVSGSAHTMFDGRFSLATAEYPIDMGRASADGLLLATFTVISATRRLTRVSAFMIAPVLAIALAAAGSRGPVVAFACGLVCMLGLAATSRRARRRLLLVGAAFLLVIIVVPLVVPSTSLARALSTIIGSASGLSSNGRSQLWSISLGVFSHHLWIGIGTGGGATLVPDLLYPHNLLLEIAVETGLVGLLLLLVALGGFIRALVRCWQGTAGSERLVAVLLISMFLTALVNAQFSDPIQGNGSVWLWGGLAVGMSARLAMQPRPAGDDPPLHLRAPR